MLAKQQRACALTYKVFTLHCALQAKGSTLAAWFSGRWEDCLDHDDQGRTFLDFDPDLFQPILSFLRSCAICSNPDARPKLVGVATTKKLAFTDLVKFLALEEYLGCACDTALQPQPLTFAKATAGFTISHHNQRATVGDMSHPAAQRGLLINLSHNCCYLKCRIRKGKAMFIGLAATDHANAIPRGFVEPTDYGWSSGYGGLFITSRTGLQKQDSENIFGCGCWVLVKVDITSQRLSMRTSLTHRLIEMPLDAHHPLSQYAFKMVLACGGDQVELLPVNTKCYPNLRSHF